MKSIKRIVIIVALAWILLSMAIPPILLFYSNKTINNCAVGIRHTYPELTYLKKVPDKLLLFTNKGKRALWVSNCLNSRNFNKGGIVVSSVVSLGLLVVIFTEDREKG